MPTLRELGIGFVSYSPLGRGFLTGKLNITALEQNDFRRLMPRTQGENSAHNQRLVETISDIAAKEGITAAQLALSWVLSKGEEVVPIPGTRHLKYLHDNIGAIDVSLSDQVIAEVESVFSHHAAKGERYPAAGMIGING